MLTYISGYNNNNNNNNNNNKMNKYFSQIINSSKDV